MQSRIIRRFGVLGVAALAASSTVAQAATQGTLGATSTGSITINASVPDRVQISNLTDVTFSSVDPGTAAANNQNVCVYSNTSTKGYTIKATGNGTSSAFTLANGALTVPYSVEWAGTSSQTSGTGLTTNVASSFTSSGNSPTCGSGATPNASLIVKIAATDLQSMQSQTTYSGTLTLLVSPQ